MVAVRVVVVVVRGGASELRCPSSPLSPRIPLLLRRPGVGDPLDARPRRLLGLGRAVVDRHQIRQELRRVKVLRAAVCPTFLGREIGERVGGGPAVGDSPFRQQHQVVEQREGRGPRLVDGRDHGPPFGFRQFRQGGDDPLRLERVEPGGGLVGEEHCRGPHQLAGDREPLALAAAEPARAPAADARVRDLGEAQAAHQGLRRGRDFRVGGVLLRAEARGELERLADRQHREELVGLLHEGDARRVAGRGPLCRSCCCCFACSSCSILLFRRRDERDDAARCLQPGRPRQLPGQSVQQRRLSAARGPHDRDQPSRGGDAADPEENSLFGQLFVPLLVLVLRRRGIGGGVRGGGGGGGGGLVRDEDGEVGPDEVDRLRDAARFFRCCCCRGGREREGRGGGAAGGRARGRRRRGDGRLRVALSRFCFGFLSLLLPLELALLGCAGEGADALDCRGACGDRQLVLRGRDDRGALFCLSVREGKQESFDKVFRRGG